MCNVSRKIGFGSDLGKDIMTESLTAQAPTGIARITPRKTRVGLVAGGLGAYWPQFPDLLPQLRRSAERVSERIRAMDCDLTDAGFISDAEDGAKAAELLRTAGLIAVEERRGKAPLVKVQWTC